MAWTTDELDALKRAYASGTLRVSYDGKTVEYGSADDLLKRIRTIETEITASSGVASDRGLCRVRTRRPMSQVTFLDRMVAWSAPEAGVRRALAQRAASRRLAPRPVGMTARPRGGARTVGRRQEHRLMPRSPPPAACCETVCAISPATIRTQRRLFPCWSTTSSAAASFRALRRMMPGSTRRLTGSWTDWSAACDADGQLDIFGLQTLAVREMIRAGEVLIRRRPRRLSDGLAVPLQIQIIEADLLDNTRTGDLADGGRLLQGIEFDPLGRRRAYWLHAQHPGDAVVTMRRRLESLAIPATKCASLRETAHAGSRCPMGHAGDAGAARSR